MRAALENLGRTRRINFTNQNDSDNLDKLSEVIRSQLAKLREMRLWLGKTTDAFFC